jgi:predicted nucleotidyltransferase
MIFSEATMRIEEIKRMKNQLYQIAARHGISKIYVFGSVARGESQDVSDVDFLVEMDENLSALGVGAFQYEAQQLLGIHIDVIPTFALADVEDKRFISAVRSDAVAI